MQFLVCFILCFPPPTVLLTTLSLSLPISISLRMFSRHATAPGAKPLARHMALSDSQETHVLPEIPAHRANNRVIEIVLADTISGMQSPNPPLPGGLLDMDGCCAITPTPPWSPAWARGWTQHQLFQSTSAHGVWLQGREKCGEFCAVL